MSAARLRRAEAAVETILSAGAIGSPQILQLSGIGPADLLRQHGIPVVADLAVLAVEYGDPFAATR